MNIIKKVGDFSIERELPSCRLHKDDIIRLYKKIQNLIRVREHYLELSNGNEQADYIEFTIYSSGTRDGIDWSLDEHNLDDFFSDEILDQVLSNLKLDFDYCIGLVKKGEKIESRYGLYTLLLRHITVTFSISSCKIRITGDSKDWIEESFSLIRDFITRRNTPNDIKKQRSLISIIYFGWLSAFLLIILVGLTFGKNLSDSILIALVMLISFSPFFVFLYDILPDYLIVLFPKVVLILNDSPGKKSMMREYAINFILAIISSILGSIIVAKLI